MAENSKIEWCDHTFNPWAGCTKVSPACDNCYAEADQKRFRFVEWGANAPRRRTSAAYWKQPLKWNAEAEKDGSRRKVFCASWADVFDNHKSIDPQWRLDLWELISETPNLDWLLLTKRPQNFKRYLPDEWDGGTWGGPWPNVWLGTTVENQQEADRRIPHLLDVPARVRFLSCEPLLGPVDLTRIFHDHPAHTDALRGIYWSERGQKEEGQIHWVIAGGESGPNARPSHLDWFRDLRDQCAAADVPFFFKQWGDWHPWMQMLADGSKNLISFGKHPDRYCHIGTEIYSRVGKATAGRLLDGRLNDEFPRRERERRE